MVGCVVVRDNAAIGSGFHESYGDAHAEVNALVDCEEAHGATVYVTLEPCCHHGKTGPCTDALIEAGVSRVVVAMQDPFAQVRGKGIEQLRQAGIEVDIGICKLQAQELNRPYLKRVKTGMPWVICKWAMTLDGRIATHSGSSQWITNEESRAIVHQIRGRVDAIVVGIGTALADNPQLTARPPGSRTAARIVLDSEARIPLDSNLVTTATRTPTLVVVQPSASNEKCEQLQKFGCNIIRLQSGDPTQRIEELLLHLGRLKMTNVLVEGGGHVLGAMHDGDFIDEVHCFIAPKIVGGIPGYVPVAGKGVELMDQALQLSDIDVNTLGDNIYVQGQIRRAVQPA